MISMGNSYIWEKTVCKTYCTVNNKTMNAQSLVLKRLKARIGFTHWSTTVMDSLEDSAVNQTYYCTCQHRPCAYDDRLQNKSSARSFTSSPQLCTKQTYCLHNTFPAKLKVALTQIQRITLSNRNRSLFDIEILSNKVLFMRRLA